MGNQNEIKGIITEYNYERGFGFITENEKNHTYFFHISNVKGKINIIPKKTEVIFNAVDTPRGLQAINIRTYFEKIEGEFATVKLPNNIYFKTRSEKIEYLNQQQKFIQKTLVALSSAGVVAKEDKSGWLTLDLIEIEELHDLAVNGGNYKKIPNGYPKTFEHLIRLLQKQINDFNYDFMNTKKVIEGEEKTLNSLKSISVSYPILKNIRLEEDIINSNEKYSTEIDLIIITDRAIFLIETKNFGGKGDELIITADSKWLLKNKHTKKEYNLSNPFKQITDHIFIIDKLLKRNNFQPNLPIIPIITLANNDLMIKVEDKETLYAKVIPNDLVGSYILNYHNKNNTIIETKDIETLKKLLDNKSLPFNSFKVLDYSKNIRAICEAITKLLSYYQDDLVMYYNLENERKKANLEVTRIEEEEKRNSRLKNNALKSLFFALIMISKEID